jgi:hypothetical protein
MNGAGQSVAVLGREFLGTLLFLCVKVTEAAVNSSGIGSASQNAFDAGFGRDQAEGTKGENVEAIGLGYSLKYATYRMSGDCRRPNIGGVRRSGQQTAKNQVDVPIQECFVDRRAISEQAIVDRAV